MEMRKGFTLIELLVVIIILGILAAIAVPRYLAATSKAKATEAVTQMGILAQEMQSYHQSHASTWPTTLNDVSSVYTTANWNPGGTPAAKFNYNCALSILTAQEISTGNYINLNVANQYWDGNHPGTPKGVQS